MRVAELIAKLVAMPQAAEVRFEADDYGTWNVYDVIEESDGSVLLTHAAM